MENTKRIENLLVLILLNDLKDVGITAVDLKVVDVRFTDISKMIK